MTTFRASHLAPALGLALFLGCSNGPQKTSGDHAGQINAALSVVPANPSLYQGQVMRFVASSPWGGEAIWSVLPESGGQFAPDGTFTAGTTNGTFTLVAMWKKDVRYTASTALTILSPPLPATNTTDRVQPLGCSNQVQNTTENSVVVGEATPAVQALSPNQASQVRHGFDLPVTASR